MSTLLEHFVHKANNCEDLGRFFDFLQAVDAEIVVDDYGNKYIYERRHLVERSGNFRVEVFSNEHPPPHFHVTGPCVDAIFSIKDCTPLEGKIPQRQKDWIEYWFNLGGKEKLIEFWIRTRPSNCSVGKIDT